MSDVLAADEVRQIDAAVWPAVVVCGVGRPPGSAEAVRQAVAFAGAHGDLQLVTVTPLAGHPLFLPLPAGAREALAAAERIASEHGAHTSTRVVTALSPAAGLARAAAGADLLVIGSHDIATTRGKTLGRVAQPLLGLTPCSLLIARRPPDRPLFDLIDLAAGSSPFATRIAARLAAEHGSELRTVEPESVPAAAAAIGCGLIVTGIGSADVRIAREAPCSVLIVREPEYEQ